MNEILKELNVLYVDDDLKACESLEHILNYYFKNVFIAHNGKEALEIYNTQYCHLLIVDYDMPVMNGYEFLKQVREKDEITPAFIVSSYDDKIKLKNAITLNLLDYITKPYDLDELKSILYKFTEHAKKRSLFKYRFNQTCYYDPSIKTIVNKDKHHKLTSYETKILEYLLKNQNKVVSYEVLLDVLNSTNQKSLISITHKINQKLSIKIIENVKNIGYILKY